MWNLYLSAYLLARFFFFYLVTFCFIDIFSFRFFLLFLRWPHLFQLFFTFDLFVTFALTYKEYYYFEWRGKEHNPNVAWDDYISHVDDYSRGVLSSTFLLSSSRFLSEDVNGGLVAIMKTAKAADGVISIQEVNKYLPALSTWFNLKAREE